MRDVEVDEANQNQAGAIVGRKIADGRKCESENRIDYKAILNIYPTIFYNIMSFIYA
jgi:hypothetical protein